VKLVVKQWPTEMDEVKFSGTYRNTNGARPRLTSALVQNNECVCTYNNKEGDGAGYSSKTDDIYRTQ